MSLRRESTQVHPLSTHPTLWGHIHFRGAHGRLGGLPAGQAFRPPLNGVPAQCVDDRVYLPLLRKDEEHGLVAHVVQLHQLAGEHRVVKVLDLARLEHHGHLHQGRLIHIEVLLPGTFQVEGVCPCAWEEEGEGGQETAVSAGAWGQLSTRGNC